MRYESILQRTMEQLTSKRGQYAHLRDEELVAVLIFAARRLEATLAAAEDETDATGRANDERAEMERVLCEVNRAMDGPDVWSRVEVVDAIMGVVGTVMD